MLFIYSLHFVFDAYVHVCVCVGCKLQTYTTVLPVLCPDSFLHRKGGCSIKVCTVRHPFTVGVERLSYFAKRHPQYEYWMAQLKSIPNLLI